MLQASGEVVDPRQIFPMFDKPETVQPYTQAQTRLTNVNAGMPLSTVLREEGKSEAFILQMEKDKEKEDTKKQTSLSTALLNAERSFNAGGGQQPADGKQQVNNA